MSFSPILDSFQSPGLIDEAADALHTTPAGQTTDGRLRNALQPGLSRAKKP